MFERFINFEMLKFKIPLFPASFTNGGVRDFPKCHKEGVILIAVINGSMV